MENPQTKFVIPHQRFAPINSVKALNNASKRQMI